MTCMRIKENLHEIIAMINEFIITFPLSSEKNSFTRFFDGCLGKQQSCALP